MEPIQENRKPMRTYMPKSIRFLPQKRRRSSYSARTFGSYGCCHSRIIRKSKNLPVNDTSAGCDGDRGQYLTIYESEFRVVAGISAMWGEFKIEAGGEIFALATHGGRLVILLVTGPGPNAIHESAFFRQDIDFFRRTNNLIVTKLGIQPAGTHHCHHFLGLREPSGPDVTQVQGITKKGNFQRWCEIVTTCENADRTSRFRGRPHRNMRLRNSMRIKMNAFFYTDPQRGEKIEVPLRVLDGISPFRMRVLTDGMLDPADIGEYASDFPVEQIVYKHFSFEKQDTNQQDGVPQKLKDQCRELPEEVQNCINFYVNSGQVTVTFLLPDDRFTIVTYGNQPPYSVQTVSVRGTVSGNVEDMTESLLSENKDASLSQIHAMLISRQQINASSNLCGLKETGRIPEGIAGQSRELPEDIQEQVSFSIEPSCVVVTLPLPDGRIANAVYSDTPPYLIHSVEVTSDDDEHDKNAVKKAFLAEGNITLKQVYEKLARLFKKGEKKNADS